MCRLCLFYYIIIRHLFTGGPPTITTQPSSQLIAVNMNVNLTCEGTGTGPITYRWEVKSINGGEWMNISNSNSTILVRNLEQSQQYRCVVSNQFGTKRSNIVTINVLSKCATVNVL